jgi:predicted Zn finger-like uncharacterized protein
MRLICPNCGAQYEVPQSVIPETGRDVQCSGCGHTWFQIHPDMAPSPQDAPSVPNLWDDTDEREDPYDDVASQPAAPQTNPATGTASAAPQPARHSPQEDATHQEWAGFPREPGLTAASDPDHDLRPNPMDPVARLPEVAEDDYEEDPANDLPAPRRLDTSIADLLREEAEREARARAVERSPGLESQPELGLDSAPARKLSQRSDTQRSADAARERMARLKGDAVRPPAPQPPIQPPAAPPAPGAPSEHGQIAAAAAESRRALLPDIEEINSSLRHTSDRKPARASDHDMPRAAVDPRDVASENPRSFGLGFSVTLLIAALLLALYVFAPSLSEAVPALAPAVDGYVAAVDQLRLMLDAQVQNLSRWLAEVAGSAG